MAYRKLDLTVVAWMLLRFFLPQTAAVGKFFRFIPGYVILKIRWNEEFFDGECDVCEKNRKDNEMAYPGLLSVLPEHCPSMPGIYAAF